MRDVAIAFAILIMLIVASLHAGPPFAREGVTLALALFTSAAGTAAATIAVLVARLTHQARIGWLGAAIGSYSLIAVPATTSGLGAASTSVVRAVDSHVVFSTVRLAATVLVLVVVARMAHHAMERIELDHEHQDEELRLAHIRLDRAAERDHEFRNGLAGLAGATNLLRQKVSDVDSVALGSAVATELNRLDDLLQASSGCRRDASDSTIYAIAPVLTGLVTLHSSSGTDLRLDVEPDLWAAGSASTLAEVVTNLLGNVERHAPASPVRITAVGEADKIVICVRDFGPGVPPDLHAAVFHRGVQGTRSSGCGLGLHICRNLLEAEGGSISIQPSSVDRAGCAMVVRLPRAETTAAADWRIANVTAAS